MMQEPLEKDGELEDHYFFNTNLSLLGGPGSSSNEY